MGEVGPRLQLLIKSLSQVPMGVRPWRGRLSKLTWSQKQVELMVYVDICDVYVAHYVSIK